MKKKSSNLFSGALNGIKVLDISNFLAGPVSSMFLGDYGAEVIKVEKPDLGDEIRYWGNNKNGIGLMYKLINRNKKSITADLRTKFGVKIIKSISVSNEYDLQKINNYQTADYFLFDYKPKKNELPGGNSKSFDWNILKSLKTDKPWFLSGGINLDNIQQILVDIKPYGVDLSSGVEKELGIKDNRIINNFIEKLNHA